MFNEIIFRSQKFNFQGIEIPEFQLEKGKLIRLCIPNFDENGKSLVHQFRYDLLSYLAKNIPNAKLTTDFQENKVISVLNPITVESYITKNLDVNKNEAIRIAKHLQIKPKKKVKNLIFGQQKALMIKCDFEKYTTLLFDYYGIDAVTFKNLDALVSKEIKRGKSGIVLDRLEFSSNKEINQNIIQIK
ncbi:hypothetical protein [Tenacibaculum jejuense]|uniref:Uncharacterized protein n=1 Tax=Tenacibaculum jejuense TaxID=584609 RepID=A0A238U9U7_9FLAO|nr:hypothetical protein [Tenacibaculum jejuense]SNR15967.1 conserved protein of unknown function [Tenacibaculum jejuense]